MLTPDELKKQIEGEDDEPEEELPPLAMLTIDVKGSRGRRYAHSFKYKVPTLGEQVMIGRMKAEYLPKGGDADSNAALLIEQICYLEVTLQKEGVPAWWKPFELYDAAPVGALYGEAVKYERRFHGSAADAEPDQADASARPEDTNGAVSEDSAGVGRKVQPAAKRRKVVVSNRA